MINDVQHYQPSCNANKNYFEVPSHLRIVMIKNLQMKNTGEDVREEETLFTVDRSTNWCIHYGNQCGDPSESY